MNYTYAILASDGITVTNTIYADATFVETNFPGQYILLNPGQWCQIGATYDPNTQTFTFSE
jgi:hypothetical protein